MKIIAEVGLNYGGSFEKAIEYCQQAKNVGADIVKFQVTDVEETWNKNKKEYTDKVKETFDNLDLYNLILNCQLKEGEWRHIKTYCDNIDIEFLATPSSIRKLDYLMDIGMKKIKIGSDRACEEELIKKALSYEVPVLISSGLYHDDWSYKYNNYRFIYNMFCVSKYPTSVEEINFNELINYDGFSDHTLEYGIEIPLICYAKGIHYYEKHFKLDDNCVDKNVSLYPAQFKILVDNFKIASKYFFKDKL